MYLIIFENDFYEYLVDNNKIEVCMNCLKKLKF